MASSVRPSRTHVLEPLQTTPIEERLSPEEQEAISGSDVEQEEDDVTDDGQSVVGISIGKAQARLMSPTTPAAEKAAALDETGKNAFFDGTIPESESPEPLDLEDTSRDLFPPAQDETDRRDFGVRSSQLRVQGTSARPQSSSPSLKTEENSRSRARSATVGYFGIREGDSDKRRGSKFSLPSLPALPKLSSFPGFNSAMSLLQTSNDGDARRSSQKPSLETSAQQRALQTSKDDANSLRSGGVAKDRSPALRNSSTHGKPGPLLRRSTSDQSLQLSILSRASSLGDDARWADVHGQVNSRMKAIKDSLADSTIRLPSMPVLKNSAPWRELATIGKRASVSSFGSGLDRKLDSRSLSSTDPETERWLKTRSLHNMNKADALAHPQFSRALENIEGDVVILGGYRGSILRWTEPPHRQCWVPVKVGLNLRKVNLEVGLEAEDEERMHEYIFPSGMLKNIGPVEISRRLFKRLRNCKNAQERKLRVWDYGYDWRLSPYILSRKLIEYLEKLPCNAPGVPADQRGATVIAHSLGGLITRHAVNTRPELFSGVVYAGVPQTCVNILGPLRNGDDVLLSSRVLTAQVNFTIRTSFALLPLDGKCFFNRETKERYDVDFFDPSTWDEYRLSPCINRPFPPFDTQPGMMNSLVGSMASVLDSISFNGKKESSPTRARSNSSVPSGNSKPSHNPKVTLGEGGNNSVNPQMGGATNPQELNKNEETTVSTAVTIPYDKAYEYLTRTLAQVKKFKTELAYNPSLEGRYPPVALIYGKSVPTVYGACVRDRESIKRADAYDDLAFASGDGVVLARAAQLPEGYQTVKGGIVSSERGHIALLGDLEAVGRCLNALNLEKRRKQRAAASASG